MSQQTGRHRASSSDARADPGPVRDALVHALDVLGQLALGAGHLGEGRLHERGDLVAAVNEALRESNLPPNRLDLEITESLFVTPKGSVNSAIEALRRVGVSFSLDDFGTGYSSLSYLRQFPIDILKIDRSFVASLDGTSESNALVRSIINLSSTLRLDTVAEGIETSQQRDVLQGLGAQRGQGHLFARAMDPARLGEVLSGRAAAGETDGSAGLGTGQHKAPTGRPRRRGVQERAVRR